MAGILTALRRLPDVRAHVVHKDAERDRPGGVTGSEPRQCLKTGIKPKSRDGHGAHHRVAGTNQHAPSMATK